MMCLLMRDSPAWTFRSAGVVAMVTCRRAVGPSVRPYAPEKTKGAQYTCEA